MKTKFDIGEEVRIVAIGRVVGIDISNGRIEYHVMVNDLDNWLNVICNENYLQKIEQKEEV